MFAYIVGTVLAVGLTPNLYNYQLIPVAQIIKTEAIVTAYSSIETCDGRCIAASGKDAEIGDMACPRWIEFGTQVVVDNKIYTCEDRTHLKNDGKYDIFMGYGPAAYNRARLWGRKVIHILVLPKNLSYNNKAS